MDKPIRTMLICSLMVGALQIRSHALTGGPTMPEYAKFEQVGADNLVDQNSGNFNYVIPLIEVPGPGGSYPLSLSYQSGIEHGQEASWVGLGWTLNPGNINRMVRGVPDDYLNAVTTTWNKFSASGEQININVGYGGFGLAMTFDANTGSFMGATPSYSLPIPGPIGVQLTPNGFNIGISHSIGLVSANLSLYDSQTGHSGKVGWSVAGISGAKGVGVSGTGPGKTTVDNIGVSLPPIAGFSLAFGYTRWKFVLNEHTDDHMCGFLFQDANRSQFVSSNYWPASSGPLPMPYLKGTGDAGGVTTGILAPDSPAPRQRFERAMQKDLTFPSADMYTVSANGLGGSFEAMVEPGAAGVTSTLPEYMDANFANSPNRNNEGWYVRNAASPSRITFRMQGDLGGNLQQGATRPATQIDPYMWDYTKDASGVKTAKPFGNQYGSQRIVPVFEKSSDGTKIISNRIKGFRIFNPDGMIYEFLQPLHDVLSADMVFEDPTMATSNNSIKYMPEKYAYTWLLTAVKGADYVSQDLVSSWDATPHEGDLGHWVVFNYTTPKQTTFSTPFSGNMPHEDADEGSAGKLKYLKSFGVKEVAFLSSIETETHRADFITETRLDGLPNRLNIWENASTTPDNPAANDAADQYLTARGVPRQKDYNPRPNNTDFQWSDDFEIPGDWVTVIQNCKDGISDPNGKSFCDLIEVELEVRYEHYITTSGGSIIDSRMQRASGPAGISSIALSPNGNTTFHAGATIKMGADDYCNWVRVTRASLNWSRLYALMGNKVNYSTLTPASDVPLVVNKALRRIELKRKGAIRSSGLIKSIDFDYDYSLCKNTPNSMGTVNGALTKGKLTLRKVTTSAPDDGDPTTTEIMQPYAFTYQGDADDPQTKGNPAKFLGNPDYGNEYKKDIWGMYKPDGAINNHMVTQPAVPGGDYPDPAYTPAPGVAWNLIKVKTPTGGSISVKYTRDQYWSGGVGIEPSSAKQRFVVPDLYTDAPPLKANGDMDGSQMLTLKPSYFHLTDTKANEIEPLDLAGLSMTPTEMAKGVHTLSQTTSNKLWKYPEGPTKPNYIKFTQTNPGIAKGDMLLIVYQLNRQLYTSFNRATGQGVKSGPPLLLTTGILNLVFVEDINSNGYKVKPLMVTDDASNFFIYKDLSYNASATSPANFEYTYYVHRLNQRQTLYGGDVAVTQIDLDDAMGNKITKQFAFDASDIRSGSGAKGTTNLCTGCGVSSGATFGMPSLYWSKYYRFIPVATSPSVPTPGQIRLESYFTLQPAFLAVSSLIPRTSGKIMADNLNPTTASPNLNPIKTFLDQAFFTDTKDGGYYWPGPGITYARTREYYAAQVGSKKLAGEIEYQFQGLNHAMLNESGALGLFSNLGSDSWTTSATKSGTTGTLTVTNEWAAKKGEVMRILKRSNETGNPIVKSEEMKYANTVTTYSGPTSAGIKIDQQPGWIRQTFISFVGGLSTTISVDHPAMLAVGKTEKEEGVAVETDYLAFDPRTAEPVAVKKTLSDGSAFVDYQEPAYWSSDDLSLRNRLKVTDEERKYKLASGEVFDRTQFGKVVSAKKSVWSSDYNGYWSLHSTLSGKLRPPIKKEEYTWSEALEPTGYPSNPYTPFTGTATSAWNRTKANEFIWRNCQPMQTVNALGEPNLVIPVSTTGHPMAVVTGATMTEAVVFTGQFPLDENARFQGNYGWFGYDGITGSPAAIADFSPTSWRMGPRALRYKTLDLRKTGPKGLHISFYAMVTGEGGTKLRVTPMTAGASIIPGAPAQEYPITDVGEGRWTDLVLDWKGPQWATAATAKIEFVTGDNETLYLNDIRVTPPKAQVNTYYYDLNNMSISAILDEALTIKRFRYDPLGRLVEKRNNQNNLTEKVIYRNYQD